MKKKDCEKCEDYDRMYRVEIYQSCLVCTEKQLDKAIAKAREFQNLYTRSGVEIETLKNEIESWKIASGLEKGGDPEKITPRFAERYWSVVGKKADRLEEENETLHKLCKSCNCTGHCDDSTN